MIYNGRTIWGIDMEATGKMIGQLIDKSGLTDKELGETMHLSLQAINKWRHGRTLPEISNLFVLSRILGVKVDDFLVAEKHATEDVIAAPCVAAMDDILAKQKHITEEAVPASSVIILYNTLLKKKHTVAETVAASFAADKDNFWEMQECVVEAVRVTAAAADAYYRLLHYYNRCKKVTIQPVAVP